MNFAPIHNHTEYSALDGLSKCIEIAQRCKCIGCTAAGITDHMTVAGHLEFAKVMDKEGLKPIFGCELYHGVKTTFGKQERDQAHFIIGALTDEGLRNVWRCVDASSYNFRFVSRVNFDILRKNSEGVFATSACIAGLVSQGILKGNHDPLDYLNQYADIYRDNFYVEIHTYPGEEHERLNKELVSIARERGYPLTYATDAHFADPDQYELHDAYVARQTGDTIYTPIEERKMWHPKALYIQDEAQIRESLSYLPEDVVDEALRNSSELADRCNAQLPEIRRHLPAFIPKECPWVKKDISAAELFFDLTKEGIVKRYGENASDEIWNRTIREMEVFLEAGLEHYFLQAWDFCEFCNRNGIKRGPGRGSAGGAIVAYALGITDIDPLKYDLIFERFYNPGRAEGFPDIDNDFPVKDRKRVRQYIMDRWGEDKVKTIGTTGRLKPKAALDKTYKAWGISYDHKERLKKIVDGVPDLDILGSDSIGWRKSLDPGKTIYVEAHVGEEIDAWVKGLDDDTRPYVQYWIECVAQLTGRVAGYGVHPSGVVVSDVALADELPCLWNNDQEIPVTCFSMADVDKRQFVKQDLLGLRNLDTLQEWENLIKERAPDLHIEWSGLDDGPEEMWELFDNGLTLGIFNIERGYARQLCKKFKPRSIEDLAIIVSLNRPGPIRSGAPDSFIARRNGETDDKFDGRKIPILADILEPTYGWFLYQEQVIAFFNALGYDLSESDAVRKILGKKKPEQMLALKTGEGEWSIRRKVVEGNPALEITSPVIQGEGGETYVITNRGYEAMAARAGLSSDIAQTIWEKLEDFAKYSFNKSHAIAYATIGFRTAFAKYFGPAEFVIACIRTNPEEAGNYVGEGRRMNVSVSPPDIARSRENITVVDGEILFGFCNVKNVGKENGRYIMKLRDSYDISTPEGLADAIEAEQKKWEEARDAARQAGEPFKQKSPRQQLQVNRLVALFDAGAWDFHLERDINLTDKQKLEKEMLGVIITDDCDEIFARNFEDIEECGSYSDLETLSSGSLQLPGAIATIDPKTTKKDNKPMGIITIEFQGDELEVAVFPRQWAAYKWFWRERNAGIFTVAKNERGFHLDEIIQLK